MCYSRSSFVSESFPQQPFPCPKKEWGTQTGDKLEEVEHLHTLQPLQDGEYISPEGTSSKGGLYVQDRPEGCLSVITPTVAKVCKLQMGGKVIPVSSPLFRSWSCPKDIHKIDENSNSSHETFKRPSYYLSRRLSDPGLYSPGGSSSTRY